MLNFLSKLPGAATLAFALSFLAAPAQAQPTELPSEAGKTWEHDWTDMAFPPRIGTFERDRISAFEDRQTNIAANYYEDTTGSNLTIYVYRPGTPSVAIWFDRALFAILQRDDDFGAIDTDDLKIGTFVPSGGSGESGQYAVTKVEGRVSSTAAAMYQSGEWLVKIRISSNRLNVGEMERLLKTTLNGLPPMQSIPNAPAYFMSQCEEPLRVQNSGLVDLDPTQAATLGLEASSGVALKSLQRSGGEDYAPIRYCRVGEQNRNFAVYRPVDDTAQYLVALSDSGRHIAVAPSDTLTRIAGLDDGRQVYQITQVTALEASIFAPANGLPNLDVVGSSINQPEIATVSRVLGDESPRIELKVGN